MAQGILAIGFLMSGATKLVSSADQINEMYVEPFGYASAFFYAIGAIETVSALALIAGYRWRRAAAGASFVLAVVMIGAIRSYSSPPRTDESDRIRPPIFGPT